MVQLTDKGHWAVEVPDDAQNIKIESIFSRSLPVLYYRSSIELPFPCDISIPLTKGSWQFLFTTKEATEEQADKVVGVFAANIASAYRNYMWPQGSDFFWSASDSLQSLLKAKGCDPGKNYAIISKQNTNDKE